MASQIVVYVERNLGFEAEHHKRAINVRGVAFRMDPESDRVGFYTSQSTKHGMAMLLNTMLREQRVHVRKPVVTRDTSCLARLREQLNIYGYQYKIGPTPFTTDKCVLSGKVGSMKDDLCICLQAACYFTEIDHRRNVAMR